MTSLPTIDLPYFAQHGYATAESALSNADITLLIDQLSLVDAKTTYVSYEPDGLTPRGYHGFHQNNPIYGALPRHPLLLKPAELILGGPVYLYQLKINLKLAFDGQAWPWHRDYTFWKNEDKMPAPLAVTAAIYLDDVTQFNGPLMIIPGSHTNEIASERGSSVNANDWQANFSADLSHQTPRDEVVSLVNRHGLMGTAGPAGTVLFFHCNLVHASAGNLSPSARRIIFVTYNKVGNSPPNIIRPPFLVHAPTAGLKALTVAELEHWSSY